MTAKKSYNRYFIIFQEEDKGYGIAIDKQPTGYTKIETRNGRCKVTVYAQNLVKDRGPYLCCLIDATKNPVAIAKLGTITVDETGRGETWWEYREDDVAETGIPVDRFNVAAVVVEGDELKAPLTGYIGRDKIAWKDRFKPAVQEVREEPQEIKAEEEIEVLDEEARKFKEYEDMIKGQASEAEAENSEAPEDNEEEHRQLEVKDDVEEVDEEDMEDESRHKKEKDCHKDDNDKDNDKHENKCKDNEKDEDLTDSSDESEEELSDSSEESNEQCHEEEHLKEDNKKEDDKKEDNNAPAENNKSCKKEYREDDYEDIISELAKLENQFDDMDYREDKENSDWQVEDDYTRDKKKKRGKHASMFHEVLKYFKEVDDLADGMRDVRWWKIPYGDDIPVKENKLYPYFCSIYHLKMTYPYINYIKYFKKPGYYYFGIKYDANGEVKYIMYGIEGRNSTLEQPYMGMTGFTKWQGFKCKDKEKGIWIMYYNPYTGCILIPKKK